MPTRAVQSCPQRDTTTAFAAGDLPDVQRRDAEAHLEQCEACRAVYRELTEGRFPRFSGYTILSELGRGGFGVVYKAFHHGKARAEALKVLFSTTPLREAYFENEVHLVAKLRHPNIATLYEARLDNPPLYYAMEFVAGQQLDEYIRARDVSLEERIKIIQAVGAAVDYAHREGVVHRDLKPQNIIIDADGQPRIVDFGIAKRLGLTRETSAPPVGPPPPREGPLGTYGYMAPEQIAGQAVDARADVYGLGVLLFHVITGQPARFAAQIERLTAILREREVNRADDLAAIIACCVHAKPEQRYATCAALVEDLERYLAGHEIRARRDAPASDRLARITALVLRNHPRAVQVLLTAFAAALLSVTFWRVEARWMGPARGRTPTALIGFTAGTLQALQNGQIGSDLPGLSAGDRKSWRLLYGRLMEKLAAARPRVVVWDYYFPDCRPEYDEGFVRGVRALGVPVVVGTEKLDVNGEPVLCPALRGVVHGWGVLVSDRPESLGLEIAMPLAVQHEFGPPSPSLAVAAFAAARFPDSDVDIRVQPHRLDLGYRRGATPAEQRRRRSEIDTLPVFDTAPPRQGDTRFEAGDQILNGRVRVDEAPQWAGRAIPVEQVLAADADQLRGWFGDHAVVIGQMMPGADWHALASGQHVFGCEVQAAALENLLSQVQIARLTPGMVVLRVCGWCAVAALLVSLIPTRATRSPRLGLAIGLSSFALGIALASRAGLGATTRESGEVAIALCAFFAVAGPILAVKLLHQRQLHLTPGPVWSPDGTTGSTTWAGTPARRESGL